MKPPSIVTKTSSKLGVPAATLRCCPHGGARAGGRRAGRVSCRLGRPVTGHSRGSCTAARLAARPPVSEGFLGCGLPGWRPEASWARWDTGCRPCRAPLPPQDGRPRSRFPWCLCDRFRLFPMCAALSIFSFSSNSTFTLFAHFFLLVFLFSCLIRKSPLAL